jgi:hypothetical protein
MTRKPQSSLFQFTVLAGVAVLFSGWAFYPPLGVPMVIANLVFIIALAVAWIIGHLPSRK